MVGTVWEAMVLDFVGRGLLPPTVEARLSTDGQVGDGDGAMIPAGAQHLAGALWPSRGSGGLTERFGATVAVDRFDLEVADGSLVALHGPSRCGKSTVMRAIAGITPTRFRRDPHR